MNATGLCVCVCVWAVFNTDERVFNVFNLNLVHFMSCSRLCFLVVTTSYSAVKTN